MLCYRERTLSDGVIIGRPIWAALQRGITAFDRITDARYA